MPLDATAARDVYDRIGRLQDTQRLYEDAATRRLTEAAELRTSRAVFELGCGTGRYAAGLLDAVLPTDATYVGTDVSAKMVRLATARLAAWASRARVEALEPPARELPGADGGFDRFVSTYVFDLLAGDHARALVAEAARLLEPGGMLAAVSLTHGTTAPSRALSRTWGAIATRWPRLAAGCRPIDLRELVAGPPWSIVHCEVVVRFAVPSQVLVARREA